MISLRNVAKSYDEGQSYVVDELSLEVRKGETLVLLGPSGCGKTTTLKMINRLIEPSRGEIRIDGRDVLRQDPVQLRRTIGYVFQGIGLFPHMTVAENVAVVPELLGWPRDAVGSRVDELLELVGLPPREYRERSPHEMSGGQQQRVGVARALAAKPMLMLMDEPFGALDPLTRDTLQEEYKRIHADLGLTSVLVTHDMVEALLMADRIAVMSGGGIIQIGTPHELMTDPHDDYVDTLMRTPRRQADKLEALMGPGEPG